MQQIENLKAIIQAKHQRKQELFNQELEIQSYQQQLFMKDQSIKKLQSLINQKEEEQKDVALKINSISQELKRSQNLINQNTSVLINLRNKNEINKESLKAIMFFIDQSLERNSHYNILKIISRDVFDEVAKIFDFQYGDLIHHQKISQKSIQDLIEPITVLISLIEKYTYKQTFYPKDQQIKIYLKYLKIILFICRKTSPALVRQSTVTQNNEKKRQILLANMNALLFQFNVVLDTEEQQNFILCAKKFFEYFIYKGIYSN